MSQNSKPKVPKDLGLKIGTPEEVVWTNVKNNAQAQLKQAEELIMVNKEVLILAERKIGEEKRRAKV